LDVRAGEHRGVRADAGAVADPDRRRAQRLEAHRRLDVVEGRIRVGEEDVVADAAPCADLDPGCCGEGAALADASLAPDPHRAADRLDPSPLAELDAVTQGHRRAGCDPDPHPATHHRPSLGPQPPAGARPQPRPPQPRVPRRLGRIRADGR
jgi:hypothetical protein